MSKYKKRYDPTLYAPFQPIIEKAVMLDEGESFEVSIEGMSSSMLEYRVRSLLEHMREEGDGLVREVKIGRVGGGIRVSKVAMKEISLDFLD